MQARSARVQEETKQETKQIALDTVNQHTNCFFAREELPIGFRILQFMGKGYLL